MPVLYVAGVPRSGSTLTDLMLAQLPEHVGVGELYYLWANGPQQDVTCACGSPFSGCDFWQAVGEQAFGGWPADLVAEVRRLQASVDRTARLPLVAGPLRPPRIARDADRYRGILTDLYRAIVAVSGARVVVDSSKRPSLAFLLRDAEDVDLRVAHVVRDPRGVAYSWSKPVPLQPGTSHLTEMPRWSPSRTARRWVTVNASFGLLRRTGVPTVVVRYEDLVARPQEELARIARLHGIEVSSADLGYVAGGRLTMPRGHTIAGSRIRLSTGSIELRTDEEWRRAMAPGARRLVSAGTWWSRRQYGYR